MTPDDDGSTDLVYGLATRVLSSVMIVLGIFMLVYTLARGGGPLATGVVFGVLFAAAGGARLYLLESNRRSQR